MLPSTSTSVRKQSIGGDELTLKDQMNNQIEIETMFVRDCLKLYACLEQYYVRLVSGEF